MSDHAQEARRLLNKGTTNGMLPNHIAAANAHATLAVAEQLRIANLIAWYGDAKMPKHIEEHIAASIGLAVEE